MSLILFLATNTFVSTTEAAPRKNSENKHSYSLLSF